MPDGSANAHLYRPKLATVVSEGYGFDPFRKDVIAALTVAIVALPLSMASAVASGVSPERGLYTSWLQLQLENLALKACCLRFCSRDCC